MDLFMFSAEAGACSSWFFFAACFEYVIEKPDLLTRVHLTFQFAAANAKRLRTSFKKMHLDLKFKLIYF